MPAYCVGPDVGGDKNRTIADEVDDFLLLSPSPPIFTVDDVRMLIFSSYGNRGVFTRDEVIAISTACVAVFTALCSARENVVQ